MPRLSLAAADDPPELHAERIVAVLAQHGVKYVLVGGLASRLHGATRETLDMDVCPAWDRENLDRLGAALRSLGGYLKGVEEIPPDAQSLHMMEVTNWRTTAGDIDVLLWIPDKSETIKAQYSQLSDSALAVQFDGETVMIASLDAIIRSKEIANRDKDREALPELRALYDAQRAATPPQPPMARPSSGLDAVDSGLSDGCEH